MGYLFREVLPTLLCGRIVENVKNDLFLHKIILKTDSDGLDNSKRI
jgi:hypothetical protein